MNHLALAAAERLNRSPMAISMDGLQLETSLNNFIEADIDEMNAQYENLCDTLASTFNLSEHSGPRKPFAYGDGIAVIPVQGTLINRFGGAWGFVTGYNYIRQMTQLALADDDVQAIVYDIDSGGGEVAGLFETTSIISAAGELKPTIAAIDASGYSAAYAIAAACNKIALTPTGGAGSIGAVIVHFDMSKRMDDNGVKVTIIRAGEHKADGSQYEPLSDDAKSRLQSSVDKARQRFASFVAERRGISLESALATEAECFDADESLELKLVDDIVNLQCSAYNYIFESDDDVYASTPTLSPSSTHEAPSMTEEEMNAQIAAAKEAATTAAAETAKAERTRIAAICGGEHAAGREALANHFAFNTDMSAESAIEALKVSPVAGKSATVEPEQAPALPFEQAMASTPNPAIAPSAEVTEPAPVNQVDDIFASLALATGRKVK